MSAGSVTLPQRIGDVENGLDREHQVEQQQRAQDGGNAEEVGAV